MGRTEVACDVLVVGAGVGGIGAAVGAAREGARTLLIEENGHPGGVAVAGMHRFLCGLYANGPDLPDATLNQGLAAEVCARLKILAPELQVLRMGKVHVLPFATRDLVSVVRSLSQEEEELEASYGTRAVSVRTEHDAIVAVTARNRAGEFDILPGAVVDCSGDAKIIQMSGAQYQVTPSDRRQLAGYTFRVKGLRDRDEMLPVKVPYSLRRAVDEEKMPSHLRFTTCSPGEDPDEGVCRLNVPSEREDGTRRAQSEAVMVHRYLSQELTAFRGSEIVEMAPEVVQREGPRVCGEYTLSAEDVLRGRKFSDGVVKNAWPIELWDPNAGPCYQYLAPGDHYEIPLRCLKARAIANCWCSGRCISATHEALGSTRVMGTCLSLGEQAGREAAHGSPGGGPGVRN